MSSASSMSSWNHFFISAGIPESVAKEYAFTFAQHRIRIDMLRDINKEILLEMGIKAMGDIIAILRHAKELYTQDELKGAFHVTPKTTPSIAIGPDTVSSRLISINNEPHNYGATQAQPVRPGLSLTSVTGSKIHSRLGLSSTNGRTSSNNMNSQINQTASSNKRLASTTSTSLTKRLRSDPNQAPLESRLTEKTLTVHYPSSSAIARAQQRLQAAPGSSHKVSGPTDAHVSIKSRLGQVATPSSKAYQTTKNQINGIVGVEDNTPTQVNRSKASQHEFRRYDSRTKESSSRERTQRAPGRLKSTVFHRLGDPAR